VGTPEERRLFGRLAYNERLILKWILEKYDRRVWSQFI
jgi:hypothetical protein